MKRRTLIWSAPSVIAVTLPLHAQASPIGNAEIPPYNVIAQNYICGSTTNPISSTFDICNNEAEDVIIFQFAGGNVSSEYALLVSPALPVTLPVGQCASFAIEGGPNPYYCGGLFDIVLTVRSASLDGNILGTIAVAL